MAFALGFFMSLGKAAVFKHVASYYPEHVGAVGGMVGMIGGLGGFILPIAFDALNDLTGLWSSCFMLLLRHRRGLLAWMHVSIRRMSRDATAGSPSLALVAGRIAGGLRNDREARHHRQRHGARAHARAPARKSAGALRGHHLQCRAARQLRPHHASSPVLSGEKDYEQIIIHGDGWYINNGITLYKGHKIVAIDRAAQDRYLRSGRDERLRQAR